MNDHEGTACAPPRPRPAGAWQAMGLDPEGLDLMAGDRTVRIPFLAPVTTPAALRRILKDLADRARAS